ncbi:MAG TPA: nucleotidyl transferase AbiEii/AbiGii toxin family protein [Solirubrobacterales bacterium]|nr:nucleotidyl transferase AbiEii/AbiGii toxin family protein [Solirubrobacterales bacterium]
MTKLPEHVRRVLPADTATTWQRLAPHLPAGLYLGGDTAVAVRLCHRESRDLDFFFHRPVDLDRLRRRLGELGQFAVTQESEGTLKGLFSATKLEFFDASKLTLLGEPETVAGLHVAGLPDLIAMKIKVMAERGEMRDYFDVMALDEDGRVSLEEGIGFYMERYGINPHEGALQHLYLAMGSFDDVEVDEALPIDKDSLERWWVKRQALALRNANRFG